MYNNKHNITHKPRLDTMHCMCGQLKNGNQQKERTKWPLNLKWARGHVCVCVGGWVCAKPRPTTKINSA